MGDTAFLVRLPGKLDLKMLARTRALAASLSADRLAGVTEIVPAHDSVGVVYVPERVPTSHGELPWHAVAEWLERHLSGAGRSAKPAAPRTHTVPVCYGGEHGPDLEAVAKTVKRSVEEVVKLHSRADYHVAAVGFTPGFPYLFGLPPTLVVPRRATPRLRVPAGSVGIGGAQTGIYPSETPGGWMLIGRTGLDLFDALRDPPALFAAGDRVKFEPVNQLAAPAARGRGRGSAPGAAARGRIDVLQPGGLCTVQDLGRRGFAHQGVGAGGALDYWAAAAANLALGNPPEAAVLECTYVGPVLRFSASTVIALLGAEADGWAPGRPIPIEAGQTVDLSKFSRGARLYVAVAGGLRVPATLGSSATQLGAGFGGFAGRALAAGDQLIHGMKEAPRAGSWRVASPVQAPAKGETVEVRLVPGPDWEAFFGPVASGAGERALDGWRFQLSAKSDRMGLRLDGAPLDSPADAGDQISRPVVPGTVQVPPDGRPIVLMAEGQTIGGYPQLGQVASIDLPKLAQARPGAEIRFRVADVSAAQHARMRAAADLERLRVGLTMWL